MHYYTVSSQMKRLVPNGRMTYDNWKCGNANGKWYSTLLNGRQFVFSPRKYLHKDNQCFSGTELEKVECISPLGVSEVVQTRHIRLRESE